ncbi:MAG: hypothetical protein R3E50_14390 [Halioglobus sp.]
MQTTASSRASAAVVRLLDEELHQQLAAGGAEGLAQANPAARPRLCAVARLV